MLLPKNKKIICKIIIIIMIEKGEVVMDLLNIVKNGENLHAVSIIFTEFGKI